MNWQERSGAEITFAHRAAIRSLISISIGEGRGRMPNKSRLWNTGEYSPPSSRCRLHVCGIDCVRCFGCADSGCLGLAPARRETGELHLVKSLLLRMSSLDKGRTGLGAQDFLALLGILELF